MIIGILTIHLSNNFGANLQAYASSRYFSSLGHKVYVLNYARKGDLTNVLNVPSEQRAAHREFVDNRLPVTRQVASSEELRVLVKEIGIELVVIGADAVWRQPDDDNIFFAQWLFCDPTLAGIPVVSMSPAHMGDGYNRMNDEQKDTIRECLKSFTFVTVRDNWTRYVINRDLFNGTPFVRLINPDPVFTLKMDENDKWNGFGVKSKGYVAVTLPRNWKASIRTRLQNQLWFNSLKTIVHRYGLQLVELPLPEGTSGMPFDFTVPYPIDPLQWFLWLKNARYFIGLRFHAIVSCCASGTPFFSIDSYGEKGLPEKSKIYNLLKDSAFENYRTNDILTMSPKRILRLLDEVNQDDIYSFRDSRRSIFDINMKQMLAKIQHNSRAIESIGDRCTSCFACYTVCPKQAITMVEDSEGFYSPRVDYDRCIKCGVCDQSCPQIIEHSFERTKKSWYGYHRDDDQRKSSSSGGVFSAIAENIIKRGGIVYGAAFNYGEKPFRLECKSSKDVGLQSLQKSKYVQSFIGDAFKCIKRDLDKGKEVLFCGTPCQVDGLLMSLRKKYDQLITIDFVCHGVPPMSMLRDHLRMLKVTDVTQIDFRPKVHSWVDMFHIKSSSRKDYWNQWSGDAYYNCFEKSYSIHLSCARCRYCNGSRNADITLADFWGYINYDKSIYDSRGLSLVMANTARGIEEVESLNNDCVLKQIDIEYTQYVYSRKREENPAYSDSRQRDSLFADIQVWGYEKAVKNRGLQKKPYERILETIKAKGKSVLGT